MEKLTKMVTLTAHPPNHVHALPGSCPISQKEVRGMKDRRYKWL